MTETARSTLASTEPEASRRLPRWAALLVAALLVGSWSVWALHAYGADVRTVSMAEFRSDLASGAVRSYVGVSEFREQRLWLRDNGSEFTTTELEADATRSPTDPPVVAVAYDLDAWRSPIRIVRVAPFAGPSPGAVDVSELVQELDAAGVAPMGTFEPTPEWHPNPAAEWAQVWGPVTGALALLALFAIRPTRGTRWFWFWVFGVPLGLGVLAYAVAEGVRPRAVERVADGRLSPGRWSGLVGFALQGATTFLIPF